ncbi:hypothetical protein HQ571_04315 [Candidatus Kuenenbacteria bacterium]|nr:hypothetical protein [Candidatus Kuenenbacteria bacterium]
MSDNAQRITDLHLEIQDAKAKQKEIKVVVKEAYDQTKEYQDILDEMNSLKAKKKQIEVAIRGDYASEFNDLDDLKMDIKDTKQVLSDLMWNELMKNNKVEVVDDKDNKYVPEVMVTLKKAG